MADARLGLNLARHADRRAHLEAHGLGKVLSPRLRALPDTTQQREPLRIGPASEFVEGRAGRLHRVVHVLQTPERDGADLLVHGRVHDRHRRRTARGHPFAADIEPVSVHPTPLKTS